MDAAGPGPVGSRSPGHLGLRQLSRPYRDADLPRLQSALAGWIEAAGDLGYCHVGDVPHRIYENLRSRRPVGDVVRLWEDGADVTGFAICGRFDTAFDVYADPRVRGSDRELEMLAEATAITRAVAREAAAADAWAVTDVWKGDDTRVDLLGRLGFERYRVWDHITARPVGDDLPAPTLPAGWTIRTATVADAPQLAAVRNAAFGETWTAAQYRDEVMGRPGYDPDRELVVVTADAVIAGVTVIWFDDRNRVGLFEPVGVRPDVQRQGLATALLAHGLRAMRDAGMTTALVEHDVENVAAAALYRRLGFVTRHETHGYRVR